MTRKIQKSSAYVSIFINAEDDLEVVFSLLYPVKLRDNEHITDMLQFPCLDACCTILLAERNTN